MATSAPILTFSASPTSGYYVVTRRARGAPGTFTVFRARKRSVADAAAAALNRAVQKFSRTRSDLPVGRIAIAPHDGRRGGYKVFDGRDYEIFAEDIPTLQGAEELVGALLNVPHEIVRIRERAKK